MIILRKIYLDNIVYYRPVSLTDLNLRLAVQKSYFERFVCSFALSYGYSKIIRTIKIEYGKLEKNQEL